MTEHLRTAHFALTLVAFILLAAITSDTREGLKYARDDAQAIRALQQRQGEITAALEQAEAQAIQSCCTPGEHAYTTTTLNLRAEYPDTLVRYYRIEADGPLITPPTRKTTTPTPSTEESENAATDEDVTSESGAPFRFRSLSDFAQQWDDLYAKRNQLVLLDDGPPAVTVEHVKKERHNGEMKEIPITATVTIIDRIPRSNELSKDTIDPSKVQTFGNVHRPVHKEAVERRTFMLHVTLDAESAPGANTLTLATPPQGNTRIKFTRRYKKVYVRSLERLAELARRPWRVEPFAVAFRALQQQTEHRESLDLAALVTVLEDDALRDAEHIEVLGAKLSATAVRGYGLVILLVTQCYWWVCVRAYRTHDDAFWIGDLPGWPSHVLVVASAVLLPCATAAVLAAPWHAAQTWEFAGHVIGLIGACAFAALTLHALLRLWNDQRTTVVRERATPPA